MQIDVQPHQRLEVGGIKGGGEEEKISAHSFSKWIDVSIRSRFLKNSSDVSASDSRISKWPLICWMAPMYCDSFFMMSSERRYWFNGCVSSAFSVSYSDKCRTKTSEIIKHHNFSTFIRKIFIFLFKHSSLYRTEVGKSKHRAVDF